MPFGVVCRLEEMVRGQTGVPVDTTSPDGLHPTIERRVLTEAVYV